jgi:integrase
MIRARALMASIRRHPKIPTRWQVRYRDPANRQRSKNFTRKVDADKFATGVETDKNRGDWMDPQAGQATFRVYADRWMALRPDLAQSSLDRDRSYLDSMILPTFGDQPVMTIRTSLIDEWMAGLDKATSTKRKALAIVRNVLEVARTDGAIRTNPAADANRPKVTAKRPPRQGRALTDLELGAVLEAAEKVDPSNATMVHLMARCGLRVGEAIALRHDDVDLRAGVLRIDESMTRKEGARPLKGRVSTNEGRTVPLPHDVRQRLALHIAAQNVRSAEGWLFLNTRGRHLSYSNWRRRTWLPLVELAGIGGVNPHDLRHTCATRLFLVDRWGPGEVQAFLGHRSPVTTMGIYAHLTADALPPPSTFKSVIR